MKLNQRARDEVIKSIEHHSSLGLNYVEEWLKPFLHSDNLSLADISTMNEEKYMVTYGSLYRNFDFYPLEELEVDASSDLTRHAFVLMLKELKRVGSDVAPVAEAVAKDNGWL